MRSRNPYRRNYYMPHEKYRRLQAFAKAGGMSTSECVTFLFDSYLRDSTDRRFAAAAPAAPASVDLLSGPGLPAMGLSEAGDSEHYDYRYAAMAARVDSPTVADLKADGWEVVHIDPRYQTRLMRRRVV